MESHQILYGYLIFRAVYGDGNERLSPLLCLLGRIGFINKVEYLLHVVCFLGLTLDKHIVDVLTALS